MTSLSLLFWIVSGILLQLAIYLGIVYWRHWMDYHALPNRGEDLNLTVGRDKSRDAEEITVACPVGLPEIQGRPEGSGRCLFVHLLVFPCAGRRKTPAAFSARAVFNFPPRLAGSDGWYRTGHSLLFLVGCTSP